MTVNTAVRCPSCRSKRIWKDGLRHCNRGLIQRFICRDCGYRFIDQSIKKQEKIINHDIHSLSRQISVLDESKNLVEVEPQQEKAGGATKQIDVIEDKIFEFKWWLKKQGYAESTIKSRAKLVNVLINRGAELRDPESLKDIIAKQKWSEGRKKNAVDAYTSYLVMVGGKWNPPKYHRNEKLPFIPMESEIDQLIAGCSKKGATFLQLLKETGIRCGEAWNLILNDVDFASGTVRITPEKGSRPRIFKLSNKLLAMINRLPKKSDKIIFDGKSLSNLRRTFNRQRKRVSYKLANLRLQRISFHTLRHWKATILYHQTKDILYVMQFLGHKNITNTMMYIQLEEALFKDEDEEFICKVASSVDEAKSLIEKGFQYVCEFNEAKMFRKRK